MNQKIESWWNNNKKDFTWNNFKTLVCLGMFPTLVLYGWTFWSKLINPLMEKYKEPKTPEEAVLSLCIIAGFVAPIFFAMPAGSFGLWIGKVLRVYQVDNTTRTLVFDGKEYFIRDMPKDQRNKIDDILSSYKSKLQSLELHLG